MGNTDTAVAPPPPMPSMEGLTAEFYGWLQRHELRFQRCTDCGRWRHVPRQMCPGCASDEWEWAASSGKGTLFTWSTVHRPMHASFAETPFAVAVVELEEGPRLMSWLVDVPLDEYEHDMAVEVFFDDINEDLTLAKFQKARP
jgi:uncharacterized protein